MFSSNTTPTFLDLKKYALRCKNESKGKMINSEFRIHYSLIGNTVTLYSRLYNNEHNNNTDKIAITHSDNTTVIMIPAKYMYPSVNVKLERLYNIKLYVVKNKLIKLFHDYNVVSKSGEKFVYIPEKTVVCNGEIISAAKYRMVKINRLWNQDLTNLSKKRRATITAMHRMIPPNSEIKTDISHITNLGSINNLTDAILYRKITTDLILQIRKAFNVVTNTTKLRSYMQEHINEHRLNMANKQNQTTVNWYDNLPH
jgi:hypothetical protein